MTYDLLENCETSPSLINRPLKTSNVLVVGRSHDFVEDERKIRIPVFCSYCDGMLQRELVFQLCAICIVSFIKWSHCNRGVHLIQ